MDADTQKLLRCALVVALVTLAAVSAAVSEVDAEASAEETGAASGVASTVVLVAVASAVVIVALVALPMVSAALPTRPVDLALQADMVADLTAIATITEEVEVTDAAMMTEAVAATAVAASIDPAREATWSHWVPDRVTAAIAAVGIAIEATTTAEEVMTIAETTASVRTKAAQATKESESCVDTNDGRTIGLVVGISESTSFAFLVFIFPSSTPRVSRQKPKLSHITLKHSTTKVNHASGPGFSHIGPTGDAHTQIYQGTANLDLLWGMTIPGHT